MQCINIDYTGCPKNKRYPTHVQSFISVYSQLLQKIHIEVLAIGLGVIVQKMGGITS